MTPEDPAPEAVPVPRTPAEALELVRRRFGEPAGFDGTPATLQVEEFDDGYVVYAVLPQPETRGGIPQPAEPGGSTFVVAKGSSEIVTLPNYPPAHAIEVFRSYRRPRPGPSGG